ncbi:hypothetical protein BX616_002757 [Lobosporangium transversale]|nr:hypothetical protein BX616_002757 [Lobosporangium transversale]
MNSTCPYQLSPPQHDHPHRLNILALTTSRTKRPLLIKISGIPAENGKCRVETQLKIGFHLRGVHGEAIMDYKQLRLPRALIAKEKHRIEKFNGRDKHLQDSEILTLDARLVCDHDMTKVLECCDNCIGRERKRAHRRKESQKDASNEGGGGGGVGNGGNGTLGSSNNSIPPVFGAIIPKKNASAAATAALVDECKKDPPTPTDPIEYQRWERSRIMVFSSTEYVDISAAGECVLPTRITCYCRHHNEKVGFRIQFTAKDWTGAVVASVLTNPVMMMDDHKSGKRALPGAIKTSGGTIRKAKAPSNGRQPQQPSSYNAIDQEEENEDIKDEQYDDDLDLESGNYASRAAGALAIKMEAEDDYSSSDVLNPLESSNARTAIKRRVDEADEHMMEDNYPLYQQSFRRKTSHDISHNPHFTSTTSSPSTAPSFTFAQSGNDTSLSPFMPGSPYANDDEHSTFAPSFIHALSPNDAAFLEQQHREHFRVENATSVLESFTTSDGSMTPSSEFHYSGAFIPPSPSASGYSALSTPNSGYPTRASFTIPTSISPTSSMLYQPMSPFSPTLASPIDCPTPAMSPSFLDTMQMQDFQSFQHQNQQQQQRQQLFLQFQQGLKQQQQQQQQRPGNDGKPATTWIASPVSEGKDTFQNSLPPTPSSSAYIPIPISLPDNVGSECNNSNSSTAVSPESEEGFCEAQGPTGGNKKRGRPRKSITVASNGGAAATASTDSTSTTATASCASSPMISPKAPSTNMPPSPSPPPFLGLTDSTATTPTLAAATLSGIPSTSAAAAAQFLLFQQQQQQQKHQLMLQQQQKQAILARQIRSNQCFQMQQRLLQQQQQRQQHLPRGSPRVQKLIPAKGPVEGGVEITLLGTGFFLGMVPTFDGVPASSIQYYGSETVVCKLPPRAYPGIVVVKAHADPNTLFSSSIAGLKTEDNVGALVSANSNNGLTQTINQFFGSSSAASLSMPSSDDVDMDSSLNDDVGVVFEYEEDKGDRELFALALQVVGMKMNGRIEAPHQLAMRIMTTAAAQQQQLVEQQQQQQLLRQQQQQFQLLQQQHQLQSSQGAAIMPVSPVSSTPHSNALTKLNTVNNNSNSNSNLGKVATNGANSGTTTRQSSPSVNARSRGPSPTAANPVGSSLMPIQLQSPQSLQTGSIARFNSVQNLRQQ